MPPNPIEANAIALTGCVELVERAGFELFENLLASDRGASAVVASFEGVDDVVMHVGPVVESLKRVLYFRGALVQELQMGLPY